ncbi:MAG TPA: chemotaxis protein CheD [Thermoanaerobaculia bacterium]|nr:chemotaxis protein CheD [Thermoanaerobaculia bacterium]
MSSRWNGSQLLAPEAGGLAPAETPRHMVYLYPGQVFASAQPTRVTTILGSCIAVCLYDAGRRVGGMNHFMLPHFAGNGVASARFGNIAMSELFAKLTAAGARIPFLQARLFGGSSMFGIVSPDHLGTKNEELARESLAARGIPILESNTGGPRGRKLVFHTDEGKAWLTSI